MVIAERRAGVGFFFVVVVLVLFFFFYPLCYLVSVARVSLVCFPRKLAKPAPREQDILPPPLFLR